MVSRRCADRMRGRLSAGDAAGFPFFPLSSAGAMDASVARALHVAIESSGTPITRLLLVWRLAGLGL
jgi:hypothetical protein